MTDVIDVKPKIIRVIDENGNTVIHVKPKSIAFAVRPKVARKG